jgi:RluA family pseudouridine synthase
VQNWTVSIEEAGQKLVTFLHHKLGKEYSARQVKRFIESNLCHVNGKVERFASTPLMKGWRVAFDNERKPDTAPKEWVIEKRRVLFEDEHFLIYDKPAAISCDESGILTLLKPQWPDLHLVHRLDRDTTGVLILAKSEQAATSMQDLFRNHLVAKGYWAVVDGAVEKPTGTISKRIAKVSEGRWAAVERGQGGAPASTEWVLQSKSNNASLLLCKPATGRTHQIRLHLHAIGHPILGDYHYHRDFSCPYRPLRPLLHARRIGFNHPFTQQEMEVQAPLPEDFKQALKALRLTYENSYR